jgi:hypothetical protein
MKNRSKAFIAVLCFGVSAAAHAEWFKAGVNDQVTIYADDHSLSVNEAKNKVFRTLYDLSKPIPDIPGIGSARSMISPVELDCSRAQMRKLSFVAYSGRLASGRTFSDDTVSRWEKVDNQHALYEFVSMLCHW